MHIYKLCIYAAQQRHTSCGGTSKETVLRSTFEYSSIHGITKNIPEIMKGKKKVFIVSVNVVCNISAYSYPTH